MFCVRGGDIKDTILHQVSYATTSIQTSFVLACAGDLVAVLVVYPVVTIGFESVTSVELAGPVQRLVFEIEELIRGPSWSFGQAGCLARGQVPREVSADGRGRCVDGEKRNWGCVSIVHFEALFVVLDFKLLRLLQFELNTGC